MSAKTKAEQDWQELLPTGSDEDYQEDHLLIKMVLLGIRGTIMILFKAVGKRLRWIWEFCRFITTGSVNKHEPYDE